MATNVGFNPEDSVYSGIDVPAGQDAKPQALREKLLRQKLS